MGYHQQSRAKVPVHLQEQLDDLLTGIGIQVPRRLIGKQDPGAIDKCPSQTDSLLFPSGQLDRVVVRPVCQSHLSQQLAGPGPAGFSPQFQRNHDVFQRRQGRDQLKRLKYKTYPLVSQFRQSVLVKLSQILTVQQD